MGSTTRSLIDQAFAFGMIQVREEITAFVEFLRQREIKNVLEIGSESGGTFYLWCQIAKLGGLKISLDKPDGESGSWRYVDPAKLDERTALFKTWAPRVKVITGDSHDSKIKLDVMELLGFEELDLLFIDGDHSYEGVCQDFSMYGSLVKQSGLIAFHDIQHLGPQQLWRELMSNERSEFGALEFNSHLHWAGIGVVQV